jgi:hypothetical protein
MFERVPTRYWVLAFVGFLLAGPIVVYSFLFGGAVAGITAILAIVFYFVTLWMIVVRKYTRQ